jgi:putative ABC transport system permease protein
MLTNYFKTALRNLWKNKFSFLINAFGLTIGITACLLIALYIRNETSYDRFQVNGERIARVIMEYRFSGSTESNKGNFTSVRVASVFRRTFPEVVSAVRLSPAERVIGYQDNRITEKRFLYADSAFFDLFSFPMLQGDPRTALSAPYSLVLTTSTARKYFGNKDPVGKILRVGDDGQSYRVSGIVADCPANSQLKFDWLASFSSLGLGKEYEESYWDANYTTYILLRHPADIASLQAKLPAFMRQEMKGQGATVNFYLEPFQQIHLHSPYPTSEPNNNMAYIYTLAAVAAFILVIACSTYINLSTARSLERAREIGVRKVIGARKSQLFWQFIGESFLICLAAVLLSLCAASLLLPAFNQLAQKQLEIRSLFSPAFLSFAFLLAVGISLAAGSYPALILTGFQPVQVLKGAFGQAGRGKGLRQLLIVFQFVISVVLLVSTLALHRQLYFIQHTDLGFDRSQIVILPFNADFLPRLALIKQQLLTDPDILSVSRCTRNPVEGGGGYNMRSDSMALDQQIAVTANPADEDFVRTVGLTLIAGSGLSAQDVADASSSLEHKTYHFLLNESAARILGWTPAKAVGKHMFMDDSRPGYVRGVVKDFHYASLHVPIGPYILFPEWRAGELLLKCSGSHLPQTLSFIESKWKSLVPERPFEYRFMDQDYQNLYQSEIRLGKIMSLFSSLAILLACLGLLGLSSYVTQRRFKEIGIRKVLGASADRIVVTLSEEFLKLASLAILLAIPLAWWIMTRWLEGYAYRIKLGWGIFAISAFLTLTLALATVSLQAIRAARANPVRSLRTE